MKKDSFDLSSKQLTLIDSKDKDLHLLTEIQPQSSFLIESFNSPPEGICKQQAKQLGGTTI